MNTFYMVVGCNGDNDLMTGFQVAQIAERDGFSIDSMDTDGIYLVHTGWHENSHKLMIIGENVAAIDELVTKLDNAFVHSVLTSYGKEEWRDVEFGDESLQEHVDAMIRAIQKKGYQVTTEDKVSNIYKIVQK